MNDRAVIPSSILTKVTHGHVKNLIGKRFGRLEVISLSGRDKNGRAVWLCRCDCRASKVIRSWDLIGGRTKSCGCLLKEQRPSFNKKHGMSFSHRRLHNVWSHIKRRCLNPSMPGYKWYGGRGITICEKWKNDFGAFVNDMGECQPGMQIDRINNDGNYEPGNCRWTTSKENGRNTRSNRRITIKGKTKTLAEWCETAAVPAKTVRNRLGLGWSVEKSLYTPYQKDARKYVKTHYA